MGKGGVLVTVRVQFCVSLSLVCPVAPPRGLSPAHSTQYVHTAGGRGGVRAQPDHDLASCSGNVGCTSLLTAGAPAQADGARGAEGVLLDVTVNGSPRGMFVG